MNYGLINAPVLAASDCLVSGYFSDGSFVGISDSDPLLLEGSLIRLGKKLQEAGDMVWQSDINGHSLLLIHCGKKEDFNHSQLQKRMIDIVPALLKQRVGSAVICLPPVSDESADHQIIQMQLEIAARCYQLDEFKTTPKKAGALHKVDFYLPGATADALQTAQAIATGIAFTKTLANLPANRCTPSFLGQQALQLSKEFDTIHASVFSVEKIREMGMGGLLAVSQGSTEPPCFIEIKYQGAKEQKPFVLVGKGITFDSGGLSLKPANSMDEMKYDMCGAASVLGVIKACALLKLPVNVVGLVACAENMLSGSAIKPGDIITTMSGQTVEILNTDAEGRVILADALTYAERLDPEWVIDIATLTGAMVVALGVVHSGFMTSDEKLATAILAASSESHDTCWRMPLEEAYQDALNSPLADMINAGFDRTAGSITAACFLSRFSKKYRWAHLDIAGTAWVSGKNRQATGRPVTLLMQILRHAANSR